MYLHSWQTAQSQAMEQLLSLYYTLDSSSDWLLVWRFSIPTGLFMIMASEQRYGLLKCRQINEGSLLEAFQTSQRERLKIRRSCLNSDVRDDEGSGLRAGGSYLRSTF